MNKKYIFVTKEKSTKSVVRGTLEIVSNTKEGLFCGMNVIYCIMKAK